MGLGRNEHEQSTILKVGIGKDDKGREKAVIGVRCNKDTPGARMVYKADKDPALDKNGEPVYRLEYDFIEGHITALMTKETDFGDFLEVMINSDGQTYRLQLKRGDRYWTSFLMRLPNVKLSEVVKIQPYSIHEEGKKYPNQGIAMRQYGEKIEQKWNKDSADGPPQAEYDEDEREWKFGKRNRWLEENVLKNAIALLSQTVAPVATSAPVVEENDDDLPF